MAPEYAMNEYLSAKIDVFSFGILVLEIVSGRKNMEKYLDEEKTTFSFAFLFSIFIFCELLWGIFAFKNY
jgi:serine/threonine protein kinase